MSIYRKRPVEVEAVQWTGYNITEVLAFADTNFQPPVRPQDEDGKPTSGVLPAKLWVAANKSWLPLVVSEWIMKDAAGFYPCKNEIFEVTYDGPIEGSTEVPDAVEQHNVAVTLAVHEDETVSITFDRVGVDDIDDLFISMGTPAGRDRFAAGIRERAEQMRKEMA
jgi:hypothetical protein